MLLLTTVFLQSILLINEKSDLRKFYNEALSSASVANRFITTLSQKESISPLELGYLGSTQMIMAKHSLLPWDKYSFFLQGKENLEKAISLEPNNTELIYLRYINQTNSPAFLNYNMNIKEDRIHLEKNVGKQDDAELNQMIKNYLDKQNTK